MTFPINDKRRLYWLIEQYLENKIDAWSFCKEYHDCYDLELNTNHLSPIEEKIFSDLGSTASRFSNIEEDLKKYPGAYVTEGELLQKVKQAAILLSFINK